MNSSGIGFRTPSLTSTGFKKDDIKVIVGFINRALKQALEIQAKSRPKLIDWKKKLKDF